MSSNSFEPTRYSLILAAALAFQGAAALALCVEDSAGQGTYMFQGSKPERLRDKDLILLETGLGLHFASRVSEATPVERAGSKLSQRSELRETGESARSAPEGWVCYRFEMRISEVSVPPPATDPPVKLTLAQFHQEEGQPILFINLDPSGALVAEYGDAVGKRTHVLISDARAVFGHWFRLQIAVRWSDEADARTAIWVREPFSAERRLAVWDSGNTISTGLVYQKLGVYRSFLERAPNYRKDQVRVEYRKIGRNGVSARFRP